MAFSPTCKFGATAAFGAVLVLIGAVFLGVWPTLFDFIVRKQLELSPGSYSYEMWETMPVPMAIDFYLFNWTNPEDLLHPDPSVRKPKLVQMGPYVFREQRRKEVVGWNDNNTVTFYQNKTWHFAPELSRGSLADNVTTLNVPAIAAAFTIRNFPTWIKLVLNTVFQAFGTNLAVQKTAGQLLFEGYEDVFLNIADILPPGFLPVTIPFDKFGWFYTRNNSATYDGLFNMYTGKGDIKKFGKIDNWNGQPFSPIYESYCGVANGSAGEFFPPRPDKDAIEMFSTDICRTVKLKFKEETTVEGIGAYRYWGDEHIFDNLTSNPDNWCFCPSGECSPNGAIDVSMCKWGTPCFISFPHFFHADPYYREAVEGMSPDEKMHQMFVDIERRSGLPLQVEASLQVNMLLNPYQEYALLKGVPKIYFPLMWFKEKARIDNELGPTVRLMSRMPMAGNILFGCLLGIGVILLIIAGGCFVKHRKKDKLPYKD